MAVTIKDIAKRAGVAHTTVSRALRGSPLISTEVADRIRKIAAEMGYHASAAARSLKTNRSQVLGVIVSHIADPFFSEVLQGIDDTAQQNGYSMFIAAAQQSAAREQAIVRTMREHRVDGVIICSTSFGTGQAQQFLAYQTPIVVVNNQSPEEYAFSIYHDDLDGSRQVIEYLLGLGHRRIAYLGNRRSGRTNQDRLSGYRVQLEALGLHYCEDLVYLADGSEPHMAVAGLEQFMRLSNPPTAIFCFNDLLACGVMQALQRAGKQVPQDCSVVGYDNIAFSAYTNPPLTTLNQPKYDMGVEAARLLFEVLDVIPLSGDIPTSKISALKGDLKVRGSTAAPPWHV